MTASLPERTADFVIFSMTVLSELCAVCWHPAQRQRALPDRSSASSVGDGGPAAGSAGSGGEDLTPRVASHSRTTYLRGSRM